VFRSVAIGRDLFQMAAKLNNVCLKSNAVIVDSQILLLYSL